MNLALVFLALALTPLAAQAAVPKRTCTVIDDTKPTVRCSDGRVFDIDRAHLFFRRAALITTCSYRPVRQPREDFYLELVTKDLLHVAMGEPTECYEPSAVRERGKAVPLTSTLTPIKPTRLAMPSCPQGMFMIDGQCRKPSDRAVHADPRIAKLIKRIARRFYRSANYDCPGKDEFVALSGLNEALTGYPIPGAGMGIALAPLQAPSGVDVTAKGEDPELPVTCGFNNVERKVFRASFFCSASGSCYQQGDFSLPRNCEEFVPSKKAIGMERFAHSLGDCNSSRRNQNGGEEGDLVLRELGPGVYLKIVQDNWDDVFYHGLIFSKDPQVIDFWRTEDESE
ncbi:MAG: hypothetical protein JST54_00905 [Deltaproteobacteria bacterium]|nr:hypothetical protein [Deltaproteobacteria bacterium]